MSTRSWGSKPSLLSGFITIVGEVHIKVSVTKEGEVGDTLQPILIEDLTSPAITNNSVEVSRVESETIKEKELSPKAGNKENLFDIQIKEIDTKLAKFDEGPNSMGCTLKSFKANNNSIPK